MYVQGSPAPSDCSHSHFAISPPSAFFDTAHRVSHSGRRAQSDRWRSLPLWMAFAANAATDFSLPSLQKKAASRFQELCPFPMRANPPEGSNSACRACRRSSRATTLSRAVHNGGASSVPGLTRGVYPKAATPMRERFPTASKSQVTALAAARLVAVVLHSWACRRPGPISVQGARDGCGQEQATTQTRMLRRTAVSSTGWLVLSLEWSACTVRPPNLSCRSRTDQHFRIRGLLPSLQARPLRGTVPDAADRALSCTTREGAQTVLRVSSAICVVLTRLKPENARGSNARSEHTDSGGFSVSLYRLMVDAFFTSDLAHSPCVAYVQQIHSCRPCCEDNSLV